MYLTHLSLTDFRNYVRLSLDMPPHITVLQGANAQGKTNFLESIYYLAAGKSPYAANDSQLVNWLAQDRERPHARIEADVMRGDKPTRVAVTLIRNRNTSPFRKHVRINGAPRRVMDLLGQINVVQFVPQDIAIIDRSPGIRRRHLDITLCQVHPQYRAALSQYGKTLRQRNALLRRLRDQGGDPNELIVWDAPLVQYGAQIIAQRQQTIIDLEQLAQPLHINLSGGKERLRLRYVPSFDPRRPPDRQIQMSMALEQPAAISFPQDPVEISDIYAQVLRNRRSAEIARGATLAGPHRDDLRFYDGTTDLHHFGSRGQQRTAVLALKLAEVTWMVHHTGHRPILLLDDVMSELDQERRRYLCRQIGHVEQAILTTTDLADLTPELLDRATLYQVSGGRLEFQQRDGPPPAAQSHAHT
jgi:DNA replication and repair protein RecF